MASWEDRREEADHFLTEWGGGGAGAGGGASINNEIKKKGDCTISQSLSYKDCSIPLQLILMWTGTSAAVIIASNLFSSRRGGVETFADKYRLLFFPLLPPPYFR